MPSRRRATRKRQCKANCRSKANSRSFSNRVMGIKLAGGSPKIAIPSICTDEDGRSITPITLMLINDGSNNESPNTHKYTIMLKYDKKCHYVNSMQSKCDSIGSVSTAINQFAASIRTDVD